MRWIAKSADRAGCKAGTRSEEHTSELQSQSNLVCRLLLEKKKNSRVRLRTRLPTLRVGYVVTRTLDAYVLRFCGGCETGDSLLHHRLRCSDASVPKQCVR